MNIRLIFQFLGISALFNGLFMFLCLFIAFFYEENTIQSISLSGVVSILLGIILFFSFKTKNKNLKKKEGYLIVTLGWLVMALSGTLPYISSGVIPSFPDAFFESISGYSTTGSSILLDIESVPKSILFWRSLTHWIGGMGIIVLTIAILPILGIGGMQLFIAEAPGPSADKLHPRITHTAQSLWFIYMGLTAVQAVLLYFAGMDWFDSINHAMSTMSTGGFSTKNASAAFWNDNPMIQYIIILFMFIAGTNFVLTYFALNKKIKKVWESEEFRYYIFTVLGLVVLCGLTVYFVGTFETSSISHPMIYGKLEATFRHMLFQVLSVMTTTGFVTADFTLWPSVVVVVFFSLFFLGGMAGSTSGGVKIVRQIIMLKNSLTEFKRQLHQNAIIPVRYNGEAVGKEIIYNILGFFVVYMLIFIAGSIILAFLGLDFISALGASASSLGNVGPAFGSVSPVDNFAHLSPSAKMCCSFLMLIGRLELFTVLILFTPYFWSNR